MTVLSMTNVVKFYGSHGAVRGVSLSIQRGEVLAVLGPSGAGKSTLASLIVGLIRSDGGSIRVYDSEATSAPSHFRVGFIPQELGLYPSISVRANLELFGALTGLRGLAVKRRIDDLCDALNFGALLERRARSLSGGEKRKVHVAIGLIGQPDLVVLDEPTAGLDHDTASGVLHLVKRVAAEGAAVWFATHVMAQAEAIAHNVVVLDSGRVAVEGSVDTLITQYGHACVEVCFEGAVPSLTSTRGLRVAREGSTLRFLGGGEEGVLSAVLRELASVAGLVKSIEVIRPSLQSVYIAVTDRRYPGA